MICSKCNKKIKEFDRVAYYIGTERHYRRQCKKCIRDQAKQWRDTHKEYHRTYEAKKKLTDNEYKEKYRVRNLLHKALTAKQIKKGVCEMCFANKFIEGHHSDYTKPLYVTWLCRECHKALHKQKQITTKQ